MNTLDLAKEGPVIPVIVINRVETAGFRGDVQALQNACDSRGKIG